MVVGAPGAITTMAFTASPSDHRERRPRSGDPVTPDPDRPAFRGNGPDDYVCVQCGNVLAEAMHAMQMTKKVRVRCGRCRTVNVAIESPAGESK